MRLELGEAIELLEADVRRKGNPSFAEINEAQKLGVEALKRFRNLREAGHYVGMPKLRGEK